MQGDDIDAIIALVSKAVPSQYAPSRFI